MVPQRRALIVAPGPTILVAFAIMRVGSRCCPFITGFTVAAGVAGGYVVQWHSSLQHEAIDGMRGLPGWLRATLAYPPVGGWLPFQIFRRSHVQHHRNSHLTDPKHDTESHYHEEKGLGELWTGSAVACSLSIRRSSVRRFIGPFLYTAQLCWREGRKIVSGDTANAGIWLRRMAAFALILVAVTVMFDVPFLLYLAVFSHPGLVFGVMRGYAEHRRGEIARRWLVRPNFIPVHPADR